MNMKVILQKKVANLGNIGDQVFVKPGYARNFLLPYGKAIPATPEHIAAFEKRCTNLKKLAEEQLETAKVRAKNLEGKIFHISVKASDEGKLFGSVGSREIAEAIFSESVVVEKREIRLPEGPIRQIGEYEIPIHLHSEVIITVRIKLVSE